jgi:hypothetical protein
MSLNSFINVGGLEYELKYTYSNIGWEFKSRFELNQKMSCHIFFKLFSFIWFYSQFFMWARVHPSNRQITC